MAHYGVGVSASMILQLKFRTYIARKICCPRFEFAPHRVLFVKRQSFNTFESWAEFSSSFSSHVLSQFKQQRRKLSKIMKKFWHFLLFSELPNEGEIYFFQQRLLISRWLTSVTKVLLVSSCTFFLGVILALTTLRGTLRVWPWGQNH